MAIPTVRHLNDLMRWLLEMLQKLGGNVLLIRHLVPNRRRGNAAPLALEPLGGPQPDPLMHIFQPAAQQAPRGARVVQQPAQGAPAMGAPLGVPLPVQMPFLRLTSSPIVPSTCSMELSPFSQTVRIDHFSHLMMANEPGIPVIRSTPFPAGQPFSFYLKILPNGFEEARFLGIVVGRMENQERQESDLLYFRLSLVDVHGLKRLPTGKAVVAMSHSLFFFYLPFSISSFLIVSLSLVLQSLCALFSPLAQTGDGIDSSATKNCSIH